MPDAPLPTRPFQHTRGGAVRGKSFASVSSTATQMRALVHMGLSLPARGTWHSPVFLSEAGHARVDRDFAGLIYGLDLEGMRARETCRSRRLLPSPRCPLDSEYSTVAADAISFAALLANRC